MLVLALLYQLSSPMHVNMEVLVQLDNALVEAVLFLDSTLADVKLVLELRVRSITF